MIHIYLQLKKKTQQFFSTVTSAVVFDKVAHMSVIHIAKKQEILNIMDHF